MNLVAQAMEFVLSPDDGKTRFVQARSFAEMLELAVRKYQNRALEAAQVIDELIRIAKEMRDSQSRGEEMGHFPLGQLPRTRKWRDIVARCG